MTILRSLTVTIPPAPLATADEMRQRIRRKGKLKGRQADEASLTEVHTLIGARPADTHRRDLLIEHLHTLNVHYRAAA